MCKKNIVGFAPKKDQYTLVSNFKFEKKINKNLVFSAQNKAKKLIYSLIDR
jgi:hypothetical protein